MGSKSVVSATTGNRRLPIDIRYFVPELANTIGGCLVLPCDISNFSGSNTIPLPPTLTAINRSHREYCSATRLKEAFPHRVGEYKICNHGGQRSAAGGTERFCAVVHQTCTIWVGVLMTQVDAKSKTIDARSFDDDRKNRYSEHVRFLRNKQWLATRGKNQRGTK